MDGKHRQLTHESLGRKRVRHARNTFLVALLVTAAAVALLYLTDERSVETLRLSGSARLERNSLVIAASTNLPTGALLTIDVLDADGAIVATRLRSIDSPELRLAFDVTANEVRNIHSVRVSFMVVMKNHLQPPDIVRKYGALGDRMTSDQVEQSPQGRRVVWTLPIQT